MGKSNYKKAGLLSMFLVILLIAGLEFFLRIKKFPISFTDNESLWSSQRLKIYKPLNRSTIFLGSSRIKFDLDINTWDKLTGEEAIQLGIIGSSPRLILNDLSNDVNFCGKVVIDVTEIILFSMNQNNADMAAVNCLNYYKKWTPSQKINVAIKNRLKSNFVFLNNNLYSSGLKLLKKTKGALLLSITKLNRQSYLLYTPDKNLLDRELKSVLYQTQKENLNLSVSITKLDTILMSIKKDCDKIKSRGGQVIFIRTPSNGVILTREKIYFPREIYWDKLLMATNCKGIYFEDYTTMATLKCPDYSHLKPVDAVTYTRSLIKILEQNGWAFPFMQKSF